MKKEEIVIDGITYVPKEEVKNSRYATVTLGDDETTLLKCGVNNLISCWERGKDLNDFDFFDRTTEGHAWINGQDIPFEIINQQGKVLIKSNKHCVIRFLKEESK